MNPNGMQSVIRLTFPQSGFFSHEMIETQLLTPDPTEVRRQRYDGELGLKFKGPVHIRIINRIIIGSRVVFILIKICWQIFVNGINLNSEIPRSHLEKACDMGLKFVSQPGHSQ
jgi:hypothetical protein